MTSSLNRKSTPARNECAPCTIVRLLTTCDRRLTRPVGELEDVPNCATPAMLTAGPIGSEGGALRRLCANCARVSNSTVGETTKVLPSASDWSVLVSAAEADGALKPPAPLEFCESTP